MFEKLILTFDTFVINWFFFYRKVVVSKAQDVNRTMSAQEIMDQFIYCFSDPDTQGSKFGVLFKFDIGPRPSMLFKRNTEFRI